MINMDTIYLAILNFEINTFCIYLYLGFFLLTIFADYLILSSYLGPFIKSKYLSFRDSSYLFITFTLFVVFSVVFYLIFNYSIDLDNFRDLALNVLDKNDSNTQNVGVNTTVNTPTFNTNVNIDRESGNNFAAVAAGATGVAAGLKAAKYVGGPPITKAAVGIGVFLGVEVSSGVMSRVFNHGSSSKNNTTKLVEFLIDSGNNQANNTNNVLNNYPLDLLFDVNTLLMLSVFFLYVIASIYISKYIASVDYTKYLPNNKFGKVLSFLVNRYVWIWSRSGNYFLGFTYIALSCWIFVCKFALHAIFNYYKTNNMNNILDNYPLDWLWTIDFLIVSVIVLLFVILNIYISKYVMNTNYMIPNNRILGNLLNRYIKMWSSNENAFLLGMSYIIIFINLSLSIYILHIIFGYYS